jgi:ankyrin repeat protein
MLTTVNKVLATARRLRIAVVLLWIVPIPFVVFCLSVRADPSLDEQLFRAVENPKQDAIAIADVLQRGANPNATEAVGTALVAAIASGRVVAIELLLKFGADPNLCPKGAWCPLTDALYCESDNSDDAKREKIAALLLQAGANPNGTLNESNNPLAQALSHGNLRIANLLLSAGANPNGTGHLQKPLEAALLAKQHDMAQQLIRAGAKLDFNETLLYTVAENGDADSIALILQYGVGRQKSLQQVSSALVPATEKNCAACVRRLLQAGARFPLNQPYSDRYTSTWLYLIGHSSAPVLQAFFDNGLNLRATDDDKNTLLHFAAEGGRADSVAWLLEHNVNADVRETYYGRTPLMVAAARGNISVLQPLLHGGSKVWLLDKAGNTAKILFNESLQSIPLKRTEAIRALESYGALEYMGARLPLPLYDGQLVWSKQEDITSFIYTSLPFLPRSVRFFGIPTPYGLENRKLSFIDGYAKHLLFAVLPGEQVIKLTEANDFTKLGFRLSLKEEALQFVRILSYQSLRFEKMDFSELPAKDSCLTISGWSGNLSATALNAGTSFTVRRYMLPREMLEHFSFSREREMPLPNLIEATEQVASDGSYTVTTKIITTPNLVLKFNCIAL